MFSTWPSPGLPAAAAHVPDAETGGFLSHVRMQYFNLQGPCEGVGEAEDVPTSCLQLLKERCYSEARKLVEADRIPICQELPAINCSLLRLALHPAFERSREVTDLSADMQLLLQSAQRRGEALHEADLYAACRLGIPELVVLLLAEGHAPLGKEALHHVFQRSVPGQRRAVREHLAQLLLDAGASVNALSASGRSPLTELCLGVSNNFQADARWLLDRGADPNGSGGSCLPLHSFVGGLRCSQAGIGLLVERMADVNLREPMAGNTPIHAALEGHMNWDRVLELKSLGADCSLTNEDGLRPAQMLLRRGMPKQAAELEDRHMDESERRMLAAIDHPAAKAFFRSNGELGLGWVLRCHPQDDNDEMNTPISDLMLGHNPTSVVMKVPLTRYSELTDTVELNVTATGRESFRVSDLLKGLYDYYQAPFSKGQTARIRRHFGQGTLGDVFGYIQRSIPGTSGGDCEDEAETKRPAVARIELRGDSVYYEGFDSCRYFEDERKLYCSLSLGS